MDEYYIAKGFQINVSSKSLGHVTSFGGIEITTDTEDTTCITDDDNYKTFMGTYSDGGDIAIAGLCVESDEGLDVLEANKDGGAVLPFEVILPAAMKKKLVFNGVVTKYKIGAGEVANLMKWEATVKVSGRPSIAAVAGA